MSQIADAEFGSLPDNIRRVLVAIFKSFLPNLRGGPVEHQTKLENFARYYVNSTTSSTANNEFSVQHGLGRAPYALRQVMALDQVGAKLVNLEVSRVADSQRVYLKSPSTAVPMTLELE
jgi:hypothetical protein